MDEFNKIVSNLVLLENMDRLQYLLDIAKKNDSISQELKNDDTRIWGCVSESYLVVDGVNPIVKISVDSDAKFVDMARFTESGSRL